MMQDDVYSWDEAAVRQLLRQQAPQWADFPVRRLASSGTDNTIFRLGDRLVLRLPQRAATTACLSKELDWLPHLAGLPLEVPVLRFRGRVPLAEPCDFGVFSWVEGQIATPENIADPQAAALVLAGFLSALHKKSTDNAPRAGALNNRRGIPLVELSPVTLPAIDILADEIDADRAHAVWRDACDLTYRRPPVWLHGDLKADNLIARDGALCGVIDWGLSAVGDPAADYAVAWSWIDPAARAAFRESLGLEDDDWLRAEGWALYGAVIALSYYRGGRNEALCRQSRMTLSRLGLLR